MTLGVTISISGHKQVLGKVSVLILFNIMCPPFVSSLIYATVLLLSQPECLCVPFSKINNNYCQSGVIALV